MKLPVYMARGVRSGKSLQLWIARHQLSGTLTAYPCDTGIYDWVIDRGHWQPQYPSQKTAEFIQRFSSAHLEHYHYENGQART